MADTRLYITVSQKIINLIKSGVFPPGSRLPGERELAERFGVSRVTVREACICLQAQGYVEVKSGSGIYVLELPERLTSRLPEVDAFELTEARALFEAEAVALAASEITDQDLADLEDAIRRMSADESKEDPTAQAADEEFHMIIARASGNPAIIFVIENLWTIRKESEPVQKAYRSVCARDPEQRVAEHQAILDALRKRKPELARKAMREHFSRLLDKLCIATEELALEEVRKKTSQSRSRFLSATATR